MDKYLNKVIQGDCLEILKELPDKCVDLVLTDPPYNTGMTADSSSTRLKNFFNDKYTDEEYLKLVRGGVEQMFRVLKEDKGIYVFMSWKKIGIWIDELNRAGFKVKNCIVWDKVIHGLNYMNYAYTHEMIIFAAKGAFLPNHKALGSPYWKDIWHISRNQDSNQDNSHHETVKCDGVLEPPIQHASNVGDIVLDPFAGTGSSLVISKRNKRNFIGIEISPEYCKIAQERLDKTTTPLF